MDWISVGGGIALIHAFQRASSPALSAVFLGFSALGEEHFFLLFLPFLFWCVDARLGLRATLAFLASAYVNACLKDWWDQPRPFVLDPSIRHPRVLGSGMPSGHAQSAAAVWGTLAVWGRRPWIWIACLLLIFLIGLSRVYLGVHLPSQVVVGWAVGVVLLGVILLLGRREPPRAVLPRPAHVALALAVGVLLALLHPGSDTAAASGTLAGLWAGLAARPLAPGDGVQGTRRQKALRFAVGLLVLVILYVTLSALLPKEGHALYQPMRFLRYAVLGLWVSGGAPRLFVRWGWAPVLSG